MGHIFPRNSVVNACATILMHYIRINIVFFRLKDMFKWLKLVKRLACYAP